VAVVGVPIAFVGSGETLNDLEPFHPDRVVSRVLGMGDVLSLIEKAEAAISQDDAERLKKRSGRTNHARRFPGSAEDDPEDGPLESIIGMLPGMGNIKALAENKPTRSRFRGGGDHRLDDAG